MPSAVCFSDSSPRNPSLPVVELNLSPTSSPLPGTCYNPADTEQPSHEPPSTGTGEVVHQLLVTALPMGSHPCCQSGTQEGARGLCSSLLTNHCFQPELGGGPMASQDVQPQPGCCVVGQHEALVWLWHRSQGSEQHRAAPSPWLQHSSSLPARVVLTIPTELLKASQNVPTPHQDQPKTSMISMKNQRRSQMDCHGKEPAGVREGGPRSSPVLAEGGEVWLEAPQAPAEHWNCRAHGSVQPVPLQLSML